MYEKKREVQAHAADTAEDMPSEQQMKDEIRRVARTLVKLMEVTQ
jgi:hypothetical protein